MSSASLRSIRCRRAFTSNCSRDDSWRFCRSERSPDILCVFISCSSESRSDSAAASSLWRLAKEDIKKNWIIFISRKRRLLWNHLIAWICFKNRIWFDFNFWLTFLICFIFFKVWSMYVFWFSNFLLKFFQLILFIFDVVL